MDVPPQHEATALSEDEQELLELLKDYAQQWGGVVPKSMVDAAADILEHYRKAKTTRPDV